MACEEPEKKRFKPSTISDHVYSIDFQSLLIDNWQKCKSFEAQNIELITYPFRLCKISNFIKSETFMDDLKTELSDVKSRRQSIDLYQFEQTKDLACVESTNLRHLYETFESDLSTWLERNTGIQLNRKISMSSSCYYDTDYLLCHDDNMGDRRIAFVLYLSKNWTSEDGGTLDLFDTSENGLPRDIVRSIVPEYNSLIFFEVLDNSYHQVAEVTSSEKSRWTINGWFHGPIRTIDRPPRTEIRPIYYKPETRDVNLDRWITDSYLEPGIVKEIQHDVEIKSYTYLANFLKSDTYDILSRDVTSDSIAWKRVGPADLRNYQIADDNTLPKSLKDFCDIFRSIAIFKLLKDYTELDLVPDDKACMDPKMSIELQRWSKGCYTLICDRPPGYVDNSRDDNNTISGSPTPANSNGGSLISDKSRINEINNQLNSASSCDNDDEDEEILRRILEGTNDYDDNNQRELNQQASCSKLDNTNTDSKRTGAPVNPDSEDSDVSDIGDYLSDPLDCSLECSEAEDDAGESSVSEPGTLDVIMQFHTNNTPDNDTIDYVDPREQEGALIHVPANDNHLCLVYKTIGTTRLHKYVNHYCKGHFYNLICTYYE